MEEKDISADKLLRVNTQIFAKQVRLIDAEGTQRGVLKTTEALEISEGAGLDLVEVSPNENPPVCRVMDYGKYLFQVNKKKTAAKKKQKQIQIKELKFRPVIEEGDYKVKLRKLLQFIEEGDKVKISMRFRGREIDHQQLGLRLFEKLKNDVVEYGIIEQEPRFEGFQIIMVVGPKKK